MYCSVCIANELLYVAEFGAERVQILSLDGLPLQSVAACGPVSGVCADDEHLCATSIEGDHALTLWRMQPPNGALDSPVGPTPSSIVTRCLMSR